MCVKSVAKLPEVFPHAVGDTDVVTGSMNVIYWYFEAASGRVVPRGVVDASGADEVNGLRKLAADFEDKAIPVEEGGSGGAGDKVAHEG